MRLLHVDASILGAGSVSRELSALIVERLTAGRPDVSVAYRDLAAEGPAHLTLVSLPGSHPAAVATADLDKPAQVVRADSDRMLAEFLDADTVIIGAPMYNFTFPSQLKAWIDRIVIPGKTFRMGEAGPEGLAGSKRMVVALARGGFYGSDTAMASAEHAESLMRSVFGFMGITDLEFILAEGLRAGEPNKAKAMAAAREAVQRLAA